MAHSYRYRPAWAGASVNFEGPTLFINEILLALPDKRKGTACVDARDLKGHIGDHGHYDTESQVEIGRRFAEANLEIVKEKRDWEESQ